VFLAQILLYPFDQMVLECTFDDLMEKVRCNQFIDIGTGKSFVNGTSSPTIPYSCQSLSRGKFSISASA